VHNYCYVMPTACEQRCSSASLRFVAHHNASGTVVFHLDQVRKRLFSLESEGLRAQFLKCFDGEVAPEQKDLLSRGCPLYIAGVNGIVMEHQHALTLTIHD
jgi:hypothetical protein